MCPDEATLLRLLAGELPESEQARVQAHLTECDACRQFYDSLQASWDQLGQWEVAPPPRDLSGAVLAAATHESIRSRWYARSAIAAAILVAAGVGWTVGRLPSRPTETATPISTEEMAQKVGLDALSGDVAGLDNLFPTDAAQEEAQS